MRIKRKSAGDVTILALVGEFDCPDVARIQKAVDGVFDSGCRKLVLNLQDLRFIDSTALGFVITTHKRLQRAGGALVLSAPSAFFRTTAGMLGIDRLFTMCAHDTEALRYLDDRKRMHGAVAQ